MIRRVPNAAAAAAGVLELDPEADGDDVIDADPTDESTLTPPEVDEDDLEP